MRALGGVLEEGVDALVLGGLQGGGVGGEGLAPAGLDRLAAVEEQGLLPNEAHGEQILEGGVGAAGHLGLPEPLAGELRPAAEGHVEAVEVGGGGLAGEPQRLAGAGDGGARGGREGWRRGRRSR